MNFRQDSQLLGDFVEAEARALGKRDVGNPMKGRCAVAAVAAAGAAFGGDQAEFLVVAQRRGRYAAALGHVANADQGIGIVAHDWIVSRAHDSRKFDPSGARLGALGAA